MESYWRGHFFRFRLFHSSLCIIGRHGSAHKNCTYLPELPALFYTGKLWNLSKMPYRAQSRTIRVEILKVERKRYVSTSIFRFIGASFRPWPCHPVLETCSIFSSSAQDPFVVPFNMFFLCCRLPALAFFAWDLQVDAIVASLDKLGADSNQEHVDNRPQ